MSIQEFIDKFFSGSVSIDCVYVYSHDNRGNKVPVVANGDAKFDHVEVSWLNGSPYADLEFTVLWDDVVRLT